MNKEEMRQQMLSFVSRYAEAAIPNRVVEAGVSIVPPSGRVIGAAELRNMVEASLDHWLTAGRFNDEFERRLAVFLGVKYLITVNSGSSANLVAFSTLTSPQIGERAIKPGDKVIGVAAGFPTTVNPILQFGAVPVFVDVDIPTYNIDASKIDAAISSKTKGIMLAHTLGNPFNLDVVTALWKKHNLWLVEDCCDALGSTYNGKLVGTFGDIGTLSFYPAHHITMGEGGAVFMSNDELRQIAESFRDWGRDCYCAPSKENTCGKGFGWQLGELRAGDDHKYIYSHLGFNLKITDMQAACALAQFDRLEDFIAARKRNFAFLRERLAGCENFLELPEATECSDPSWFGFPITLREAAGVARVDLLRYLDQNRIGMRMLFAGNLVRQPYIAGRAFRVSGELANTSRRYRTTLEPLPASEEQRSVSKTAVSRRFMALSAQRLDEWLSAPLDKFDLPVLMIDGIHFWDRVVLIVLGIDAQGNKHVLGLREGGAENAAVVQRCQEHKRRNVLDHLPKEMYASIGHAA